MKYQFDQIINRRNTDCAKWDALEEVFGTKDVLPFWVADMDFPVAEEIKEALQKRVEHGIFGYPNESEKVFQAVAGWMKRRNHVEIKPEWIVLTAGVVPAVQYAIQAFSKPNDFVILQPPIYHSFFGATRATGRQILENPLKLENGQYEMDFAQLETLAAQKPKIMILCNPQNPSGRVWSKEDLSKVSDFCNRNGILLVSDDIHSDLIYKGYQYTPALSLGEETRDNLIACYAVSKTFNLAGLNTSAIIIPNEKLRTEYKAFMRSVGAGEINLFGLLGTEVAYTCGDEWLEEVLTYLEGNLDYMEAFLKENLPQVKMMRPESTYMTWLDFSALGMEQKELEQFLIQKAKVGLNSGTTFGRGGEGYMRFNFGTPRALIKEGLERIKAAVDGLSEQKK